MSIQPFHGMWHSVLLGTTLGKGNVAVNAAKAPVAELVFEGMCRKTGKEVGIS